MFENLKVKLEAGKEAVKEKSGKAYSWVKENKGTLGSAAFMLAMMAAPTVIDSKRKNDAEKVFYDTNTGIEWNTRRVPDNADKAYIESAREQGIPAREFLKDRNLI